MFDQYLAFAALEAGVFSLAQPGSYLALNDPTLQDTQVAAPARPGRPGCLGLSLPPQPALNVPNRPRPSLPGKPDLRAAGCAIRWSCHRRSSRSVAPATHYGLRGMLS